jgi:hypothetical protein
VPVVLRLMALVAQLSESFVNESDDQSVYSIKIVSVRTSANSGRGVSTAGTGLLLDVEGGLATASADGVGLGSSLTKA